MRNRVLSLALITAILAAGLIVAPLGFRAANAQGGKMVVCDSTLITLLYVAEANYGFKSMMDVATIDKGQFKPLFDAMMAKGGTMMEPTKDAMMQPTKDAMMEPTKDAMMQPTKDAMMMSLKAGVVQGEDGTCTKLRAEVEAFLYEAVSKSMMKK